MIEKFDTPNESGNQPAPGNESRSLDKISTAQGIPSNPDVDSGSVKPDEGSLDPPYDPKDLSTRGGHPLPKVVDTPHTIEHQDSNINLERGPQESGANRILRIQGKEVKKDEGKEGTPGSLDWNPRGGIERGG